VDNLSDYIQWMGDYPFSATGFREADALILCVISYFDLAPVFEKRSGVHRVKDCADMLAEGRARLMITGKDLGYRQILERAAASRRFGQLRMTNYVDRLRSQPPLQFSAVCFHDEADLSFLAYRGTDNSLAGWKEDFMISFCRTEAQEMALQYARTQLKPGRRWLLGGHSKGGNLACIPPACWRRRCGSGWSACICWTGRVSVRRSWIWAAWSGSTPGPPASSPAFPWWASCLSRRSRIPGSCGLRPRG